jgi:hypothetical protein
MDASITAPPNPFVNLHGCHFATILADPPRPPLPTAEPPDALPAAKPQQVIEGPRKSLARDLNDELGF